jgi:signal peptidase I
MNFLQRHRLAKDAKNALSAIRTARRWRIDVAAPELLSGADAAETGLRAALRARDWQRLPAATETALAAANALFPPPPHPVWREYVELFVVALSLAMACRTYFLQPFKIPTGSMQPTLNGITASPQESPAWTDRFPVSLIPLALFGERYTEVRADSPGRVERDWRTGALRVAGRTYDIPTTFRRDSLVADAPRSLATLVSPGDRVRSGDLLASGRVRCGDHVLVNKIAYHFSRPSRGDVIVFDTAAIDESVRERYGIVPTFYIKRLAGLPGETVSIADGRLLADGVPVTAPACFEMLATDPAYAGYVTRPGSLLQSPTDALEIPSDRFLPLGDNTYSSLDGRYFGPVPLSALVGPAFFVYWPFRPHFGPI